MGEGRCDRCVRLRARRHATCHRSAALGDLEKSDPGDFSIRRSQRAVSERLHCHALGRTKMAVHPCAAQAT